jgi:hypothetical protein
MRDVRKPSVGSNGSQVSGFTFANVRWRFDSTSGTAGIGRTTIQAARQRLQQCSFLLHSTCPAHFACRDVSYHDAVAGFTGSLRTQTFPLVTARPKYRIPRVPSNSRLQGVSDPPFWLEAAFLGARYASDCSSALLLFGGWCGADGPAWLC